MAILKLEDLQEGILDYLDDIAYEERVKVGVEWVDDSINSCSLFSQAKRVIVLSHKDINKLLFVKFMVEKRQKDITSLEGMLVEQIKEPTPSPINRGRSILYAISDTHISHPLKKKGWYRRLDF